jgi:hypothetical protein
MADGRRLLRRLLRSPNARRPSWPAEAWSANANAKGLHGRRTPPAAALLCRALRRPSWPAEAWSADANAKGLHGRPTRPPAASSCRAQIAAAILARRSFVGRCKRQGFAWPTDAASCLAGYASVQRSRSEARAGVGVLCLHRETHHGDGGRNGKVRRRRACLRPATPAQPVRPPSWPAAAPRCNAAGRRHAQESVYFACTAGRTMAMEAATAKSADDEHVSARRRLLDRFARHPRPPKLRSADANAKGLHGQRTQPPAASRAGGLMPRSVA